MDACKKCRSYSDAAPHPERSSTLREPERKAPIPAGRSVELEPESRRDATVFSSNETPTMTFRKSAVVIVLSCALAGVTITAQQPPKQTATSDNSLRSFLQGYLQGRGLDADRKSLYFAAFVNLGPMRETKSLSISQATAGAEPEAAPCWFSLPKVGLTG